VAAVSELPNYKFDGYKLRPSTVLDRVTAHLWNEDDPDHAWEKGHEYYWVEQRPGVNSYLLEDEIGQVIFFFKMIRMADRRSIEVNMQFPRKARTKLKWYLMQAMIAGFGWLEKTLPENGIDIVYFNSKSEPLIAFAQAHLGFVFDSEAESGFKRFKRVIPTAATV